MGPTAARAAGWRAWVAAAVRPGSRVVRVQRLHGGITSVVHAVDVVDPDGIRHRLVLRRYPPGGVVEEPASTIGAEVRSLQILRSAGVADVPRLVAVDRGGSQAGVPAVVSTRLPGAPQLGPVDPVGWAERLADRVAAHLATMAVVDPDGLPPYEHWHTQPLTVPPWASDAAVYRQAMADLPTVSANPPQAIHRDLNPGNILWHRGRPGGIVDWVHLCRGPVEEDIGRCRINIWLLAGRRAADAYLARIETAGLAYDRRWDHAVLADLGPYLEGLLAANHLGARLSRSTLHRRAREILRR